MYVIHQTGRWGCCQTQAHHVALGSAMLACHLKSCAGVAVCQHCLAHCSVRNKLLDSPAKGTGKWKNQPTRQNFYWQKWVYIGYEFNMLFIKMMQLNKLNYHRGAYTPIILESTRILWKLLHHEVLAIQGNVDFRVNEMHHEVSRRVCVICVCSNRNRQQKIDAACR